MVRFIFAIVVIFALGRATISSAEAFGYELIEGSRIIDDCSICGRPPIVQSLRGSLELRLLETDPLFSRYTVEKLELTAAGYKVTGAGRFEIGGEVALVQRMWLTGQVSVAGIDSFAGFTNENLISERWWPMLKISLLQTNGNDFQRFTLDIVAAPFREVWFSTASGFHSANLPTNANAVSAGDLLGTSGRIIKHNQELFSALPLPVTEDAGLDAIDMQPTANIAISTDTDFSAAEEGDLFLTRTTAVFTHEQLLEPLLGGSTASSGLDALHIDGVLPNAKVHFSIEKDIRISQDAQPPIDLRKGDLLWVNPELAAGGVFKRNRDLLARFDPSEPDLDYGLDALYIWPHGEIWFSTEEGFQDKALGAITSGDLLSDQGYLAFKNLELLERFAPIEDASSFGLDGLYIVSDVAPANVKGARISISQSAFGGPVLRWTGQARVFQVERTFSLLQEFEPFTPLLPDLESSDTNAVAGRAETFYRLRQW